MLRTILSQFIRRARGVNPHTFADGTPSMKDCTRALAAGDIELAVECLRDYLTRHPRDADAHNNLGVALQRLGQKAAALESYAIATRIAPKHADALYNAGLIHHVQGDLAQAEHCYRMAIASDPHCAEAHREFSMLRLSQQDFTPEVWSSFRQRRLCQGFAASTTGCKAAQWSGEPLDGSKVLVYGEQGLGDEILFASCYPDLIASAGSCVVETEPRLESMFRRSFPAAVVLGRQRVLELKEHYDGVEYVVPCGDLPLHFRCSATAFPDRRAYLAADEALVQDWGAVLSGLGPGLKVGISWRGGTPGTNQAIRSVELEHWRPVFEVGGTHLVSLQYGECESDIAAARSVFGRKLHHWPDALKDYDQTAALVMALDLVITVTTSVAHLSGALGKRTWILANAAPRWCYLASGRTTPWCPSSHIFRQTRMNEWDEVMAQVADELRRPQKI